jgi:hypothetical protein
MLLSDPWFSCNVLERGVSRDKHICSYNTFVYYDSSIQRFCKVLWIASLASLCQDATKLNLLAIELEALYIHCVDEHKPCSEGDAKYTNR